MSDRASNPTNAYTVPSVSITTARTGASSKANELGVPVKSWDEFVALVGEMALPSALPAATPSAAELPPEQARLF